MEVFVNGERIGHDLLSNMGWPFGDLVAYASRDSRVVPGDVLGSGTAGNGGCLAELWGRAGELTPPPLAAGDEVVMRVEGIGEIRNTIGAVRSGPRRPSGSPEAANAPVTALRPATTPHPQGDSMTNSSVEAPRAAARKAGIWQAVLLLAGSCLPVLGAVLITPILPQLSAVFADEPGAEVLVPMIVAIPALMIAIFAPFAGQIVDRLGRKGLLIIAMVAYAFVGTAPAYLESLQLILLTRVGVGITEAAIMTVCTTLIVDYFHEEKQRNKYLGLQTVATTLAATVFIILGGALGVGGWHTPFWVYAISLVIAVPMIFLLWEPGPRRCDR